MQPRVPNSDSSRSVVLVLLETGARLVESIAHASNDGPELIVVAQEQSDGARGFGLRAAHRIAALERSGRAASRAVVAVGDRSGERTTAARSAAARLALRHLKRSGRGVLVLQASETAGHSLRHELLSLAGSLTSEIAGADLMVRVRFGGGSQDLPDAVDCSGAALASAI
jgi:hypothetical protein